MCVSLRGSPQHTTHPNGRQEATTRPVRAGGRSRGSAGGEEPQQPHVGNYRLLKTIGKGNFAKVKLARHILTGREVSHGVRGGQGGSGVGGSKKKQQKVC